MTWSKATFFSVTPRSLPNPTLTLGLGLVTLEAIKGEKWVMQWRG